MNFENNDREFKVGFEESQNNSGGSSVSKEEIAVAVEEYFKKNPVQGGTQGRIGYVTIYADRWEGEASPYMQVVALEGVTANDQVDLTPNGDQLEAWRSKAVTFVAENHGGVVIVKAVGQKPQHDYEIQVTIFEVTR